MKELSIPRELMHLVLKECLSAPSDNALNYLHFALVSMVTENLEYFSKKATFEYFCCGDMTRLCVLKLLKGHIQRLAKIQQPAKCIDKEGNVALKVAIGQVCPLHNQNARKPNDDDQSSSHRQSALGLREKSTIRLHGRN